MRRRPDLTNVPRYQIAARSSSRTNRGRKASADSFHLQRRRLQGIAETARMRERLNVKTNPANAISFHHVVQSQPRFTPLNLNADSPFTLILIFDPFSPSPHQTKLLQHLPLHAINIEPHLTSPPPTPIFAPLPNKHRIPSSHPTPNQSPSPSDNDLTMERSNLHSSYVPLLPPPTTRARYLKKGKGARDNKKTNTRPRTKLSSRSRSSYDLAPRASSKRSRNTHRAEPNPSHASRTSAPQPDPVPSATQRRAKRADPIMLLPDFPSNNLTIVHQRPRSIPEVHRELTTAPSRATVGIRRILYLGTSLRRSERTTAQLSKRLILHSLPIHQPNAHEATELQPIKRT